MLKKVLSAIVLIMFVTSILAFSIKPANCATVLSQNFDFETTGSVPQGWTVANSSLNSLTVNDTVFYGSSGKSARYAHIASPPGGCAYVGRNFTDQQGALSVSFAIMAENADYFMFYLDGTDAIYHGPNIYFMPYGYLAYYDNWGWHDLCPSSANIWYMVRWVINIPTNTYDIYINNVLLVQGAHFRYYGQTTHINDMNFGGNSWEMDSGFIDDISIETLTTPPTTVTTITGSQDFLLQEDVNIRIDAQVNEAKTMALVSNATVTIDIYYPNGSLLVSDIMVEKFTGVYEWESNETIHQMNLEKGVYLVHTEASATGETPSSAILSFHVDPPPNNQPALTAPDLFFAALAIVLAATMLGVTLHRRQKKGPLKTTTYIVP
jgi:hypothetical protein